MLAGSLGLAAAADLGLLPASVAEAGLEPTRLNFGPREALVDLVQHTPPDQLLPRVVKLLREGTDLKEIVAATALANARRFGGEDYIGFHTFMALAPAYAMTQELPTAHRALPVLKVLYRNAARIKDAGGPAQEVLKAVPAPLPLRPQVAGDKASQIRDAVHQQNIALAEQLLQQTTSAEDAWNDVLQTAQEATEVHRVVLAHRSWDMLRLVGEEHARTMLRQSLRYCVKAESPRVKYYSAVPALLTRLFDQHKLAGRPRGTKPADVAWISRLSDTLFNSTPEQAADAVAGALAEGFAADPISDAISLTANQLLLRDMGRTSREAQKDKPVGSVHGDSIGVHASDSANAWRQIALSSNPRNSAASLILAGYQVAQDRLNRGGQFLEWKPRPYAEALEKVSATTPDAILKELDGTIRENNQNLACALAHRYLEQGYSARGLCDILLSYALSEDGALHAEKFYRTATDEYARLPASLRNRQLVALARVTASCHGYPAPGYAEARKLLET
jgi:hypothetical protein